MPKASTAEKTVKEKKEKKPAKEKTPRGPTVRERALRALKAKDMTATEVQTAIGLGHGLKPTLDQEVERGHLAFVKSKDENAPATYHLTALGRKALEKGDVNPPRAKKEAA